MSAAESVEVEPEYLDTAGVAARVGVKKRTVIVYLSRGDMPEPDLVWYGVNLWLVSTIEEWRAQWYKRRSMPRVPRTQKITTQPRSSKGRPRVVAPASSSSRGPAAAPNRRLAKRASREAERPEVVSVGEPIAKQVAAALRADGFYCTTVDVLELADAGEQLEHERELLRQRIAAKLRALRSTSWR